jgi:hypothetical protein
MPDTLTISWFEGPNSTWHKVLGWVHWADTEPWTALTACGSPLTADDRGREVMDPPASSRCRKCDVAELLASLPGNG